MDPNICRRVKFLIGCPVMIIQYLDGNLFDVLESCLASQCAVCAVGHCVFSLLIRLIPCQSNLKGDTPGLPAL